MVSGTDILTHVQQLRRYAALLCRDREDAEDLVQSTLEKALRHAHKFRRGFDLRVWLFAILHNTFVSTKREARSRRDRESAWSASEWKTVLGNQELSAELVGVMAAVDTLPEAQRRVILLVSVEGLTTEEVADALALPLGTIRSRLARGREALRHILATPKTRVTGSLKIVGGRDAD